MSRAPTKPNFFSDILVKLKFAHAKVSRRSRQLRQEWGQHGSLHVLDRVRRAVATQLAPTTVPLPVRPVDVLASDLTAPKTWSSLPFSSSHPLVVNWITTPPSTGSGGHTTMFRLIEHLERAGNLCRIYIYDVYGGDTIYYRSLVRALFPRFAGEVNNVASGMADAHAVVATSWPTAYPANNDGCRGKRFYLVQDFEPWFYPLGARSELAENTYRMGFHAITAGRFLAAKLRNEYGMVADSFDFGCDTKHYHILERGSVRDGIVFYAKPEVPRRAFELGLMALQLFSESHPDLTVHFYGSRIGNRIGNVLFPFIDHGVLPPDELNLIYNRCFAGLSLSMTNVSLVPHEMLSAGCIPVVNEAQHTRIVLDNPFVRYAPATPHALAGALGEVVDAKNFAALAASASASVSSVSWEAAGSVVEQSIRRALVD
jgi:O-antigen biosynthesis protein